MPQSITNDPVEGRLYSACTDVCRATMALRSAMGFYKEENEHQLIGEKAMMIQVMRNLTEMLDTAHLNARNLWKEYCKQNGYPTGGDE